MIKIEPGITKCGNYTLVNKLGEGGYAEVWLGEHDYMDIKAAIKILHPVLPTSAEQASFLDEARHLAGFNHPNIVRVMECGIQNGDTPFLVLEYASNGNLRTRHPKGTRLPPEMIVGYVRQIADGLRYAHNRRLIHRDVKPENILISENNGLLVSDFGIAAIEQTISFTSFLRQQQQQVILGTLGYMAPEQYDGYPIAASDQYSLAVVVYEWLCGQMPFKGTADEIRSLQKMKPPPLRDKAPGISLALEQVVLKALSEGFDDRFPNIVDFADALEQVVNNPNIPWFPNPSPMGGANPGAPPFAAHNANAHNGNMGANAFGANNVGPSPLGNNANANNPYAGSPPLGTDPFGANNAGGPSPWGNNANANNPYAGSPPLGANNMGGPPPWGNPANANPGGFPGANNVNPGGPPLGPDPFSAATAQAAPNMGGNPAQAGAPPYGNNNAANPFGQPLNNPLNRADPNAPTERAGVPPWVSYGTYVPPTAPPQAHTGRQGRSSRLFDWRGIWKAKHRLFVFGGGAVDFLLAVALGIYLNDGYASWNLWLGSIVVAWTTRILCAGVGRRYLAIPLALALAFYWFLGSWAFATSFNLVTHINLVPPYIVAILFGAGSAVMHVLYANKKK